MTLQEAKFLIQQHPGQFYTYLLKRPEGDPFYVGKGNCKGFRIEEHHNGAKAGRCSNKLKQNIIRKIWEEGNQIDYEIVLFSGDEKLVFDKEMELISFYGRRDQGIGMLCNMTDGGEGINGHVHSEKTRKRLSQANTGKKHSEEVKKNISRGHKGQKAWNKGLPMSLAQRKKLVKAWENRSRIFSEEYRQNMSKIKKGHITSLEARNKISKKNKGRVFSQEHKRKLSEAHIGMIAGVRLSKQFAGLPSLLPTGGE